MIITLKGATATKHLGGLNFYSIIVNKSSGITVTLDKTTVSKDTAASETVTGTLTVAEGYTLSSVVIKMGDTDKTSAWYNSSTGAITISGITANVVITANATANSGSGDSGSGDNGSGDSGSGDSGSDGTTTWYPEDPSVTTVTLAQLGANYAFAKPKLPDTASYHLARCNAKLNPKTAANFDISLLVGEFDESDNSLLIVKKYPYTIENNATGEISVSFDVDITLNAGQLIGIEGPTHYIFMVSGSPYTNWDMLFGTVATVEGQKVTTNPSTAAGKLPQIFFEGEKI